MGLAWRELEDAERQRLEEVYLPPSTIRDLVRYENGVLLPRTFVTDNWAEKISKMELRDDDIWILSYPKTGTTWTIELVWMLINDLKLETANIPEHLRCPILEGASVITCDFLQSQAWLYIIIFPKQSNPRSFISQFPRVLLVRQNKIIFPKFNQTK